ncbi:MAG: hypothetical protein IKP58_01075 [Victivallales bacterium]|nr:hypothetical protein [Victivallales bacterium]
MKLKDIRFNLRFSRGKDKDGEEEFDIIRSLKDLEEHLNIDDLYLYFDSGQLVRWLTCIGESSKSEAISKIDKTSSVKDQLNKIFDALGFGLSKNDLATMIESYTYFKMLEDRRHEMFYKLNKESDIISQDYLQYEQCLQEIVNVFDDFKAVRVRVNHMLEFHSQQFNLDWMRFYDLMSDRCPLAIFAVLMNHYYRNYYLGGTNQFERLYYMYIETPDVIFSDESGIFEKKDLPYRDEQFSVLKIFEQRVSQLLYVVIFKITYPQIEFVININIDGRQYNEKSYLLRDRKNIKEVDYGKSGGTWENAEDEDQEVLILHCGKNIAIRPAGDKEHQYKGDECGSFPIFQGLDFKTTVNKVESRDDVLLYLGGK